MLGSHVTALGVLRVLGRRGVPLWLAGETTRFVTRSRWYRPFEPGLRESPDPEPLAEALERAPFERAVLFPCSDEWVAAVGALPSHLRERCPAPVATAELLDRLLDKGRFGETLREHGIPAPRTVTVRSADDLESVPDLAGWFLKPRSSQEFSVRFGVKAFRVRDRDDAAAKLLRAERAGLRMVLQEYVPGPPTAHVFVDGYVGRDGAVRALLGRRRIRMDPPDFGNSSYLVSVPLETVRDARETVGRLLTSLDYRGIFSVELKRDARDGVHRVLEVNARPWWYVEFAARCGVDVCWLAYRDLLALGSGDDPPSGAYRAGARCVFPSGDARAFRRARAAGTLSAAGWARSLVGAQQPLFTLDDPLPALSHVVRLLARAARRRR